MLFHVKLFDPNKHVLKKFIKYCGHKKSFGDSIGNISLFFLKNYIEL